MRDDFIGRIVGWHDLYRLAEGNYDAEKGEEPYAFRSRWGLVEEYDESVLIPVLHVRDIHNGEEGLLFSFETHTVMPVAYSA